MAVTMNLFDILAFVLLVYLVRCVYVSSDRGPVPPGPRGWPIIGNLFDMPAGHQWQTFALWGHKWGDIVSINMLGQRMVILNSFDAAEEILDKKSAIYSDRPYLPVCGGIMNCDHLLAFQSYGTPWRDMRRLFSQTVGTHKGLMELTGYLEDLVCDFLRRAASDPQSLTLHVQRFTAESSLKITYGYTVEKERDEFINIVDTAMERFNVATSPGAFLADVFPILTYVPAWFPGAQWKRNAQAWRKDMEAMCNVPFQYAKAQISAGTAVPSMIASNMDGGIDSQQEAYLSSAAAALYSGASDTTVSAICSFYIAMMRHPDVQKKAQAEIDSVVGPDRLPGEADRERLPYLRAVLWEVLRWQPIGPLGLPHRLRQDDTHAGYFIPKDTIVLANIWQMLRDPRRYSCPEQFNPERFVPRAGFEPETDPRHMVFGFGRRVCPGSHLAELTLFLIFSMSLASFDITKPVVDGRVIEPSMEYTSGTIRHPVSVQCSIKLRSAKVETLLSSR